MHGDVRDDDTQSNNALAETAPGAAEVGRVVGSLRRKGGEPDDDEEEVDGEHGVDIGESTSALEPRRHDEVDPSGNGEEELEVSRSAVALDGLCVSMCAYDCECPAIVSDNLGVLASKDGEFKDPEDESQGNLGNVKAELDWRDAVGIKLDHCVGNETLVVTMVD